MTTLESLVKTFHSNHLYPTLEKHEDGRVESLQVFCPSIQSTSRMKVVESLIGKDFKATFFSNEEIIKVQSKQPN